MRHKRLISLLITLAIVIGVLPFRPVVRQVNAATDPEKMNVVKTVDWDENDRTKAGITITSDVPGKSNTNVLFLGTICGAHDLKKDTLVTSLNSIANNANVYYYFLDVDNANDYNIVNKGFVERNSVLTQDQENAIPYVNSNVGKHAAIKSFTNLLYELLIDDPQVDYDYIVFEFDGSRIAETGDNRILPANDVLEAVASKLQSDFYSKDRIICITDGTNPENGSIKPRVPFVPTNYVWLPWNYTRYLWPEDFRALCGIFAPSYYLAHKDENVNSGSFGYRNPSNNEGRVGTAVNLGNIDSKYILEYAVRGSTPDYVYGSPENEYKVFPNTSRQLYYTDTKNIAEFFFMAIEGTTVTFNDRVKVADNLEITDVSLYIERKTVPSTVPSPTPWIPVASVTVKGATPVISGGVSYVEDASGILKITKGNTNADDNNIVSFVLEDVKNEIKNVKVVINLVDTDKFNSCIEVKMDASTSPAVPLLDKDGNYQFEMNPNNGEATFEAFKDSSTTGNDPIGKGFGVAAAPPVDIVEIESSVTNGDQDYDTSNQIGQIKSTDPYTVVTHIGDTAVLTYEPDDHCIIDSVTIDGDDVDISSGTASSTTAGSKYNVEVDDDDNVTVTLPDLSKKRTVAVVYKPVLKITKSITSPTSSPVKGGDTIWYSLVVSNSSDVDETGVTITDVLDTSLVTFDTTNTGCSYDDTTGTVTWSNVSVDAHDSTTLTFKVTVKKDLDESSAIKNAAQGTYSDGKPIPKSNETSIDGIGRDVTFVYNIVGTIPTPFVVPSPAVESYGSTMSNTHLADATVTPIPGYTFSGWYEEDTFDNSFVFTNTINNSNYNISNDDKIQIYGKFTSIKDFDISKTAKYNGQEIKSTDTIAPGSTVTYEITVTNNNKYVDFASVIIEDVIDSGLTIESVSPDGTVNGQKVTWDVAILKDSSVTLSINVTVPGTLTTSKDYSNFATIVEADNEDIDEDSNTFVFTAKPELVPVSVIKVWPDWEDHQDDTVYIRLYKNGTPVSASATEDLIELTYSNPSWTDKFDPYDDQGKPIVYTFKEVTLDSGSEVALEDGDTYNTRYLVSYSTSTDGYTTTIRNDYVIDATDLEFTKSADRTAAPGDELVYKLTVTNTRKYETANDIKVTDVLPTGVTLNTNDPFELDNTSQSGSDSAEYKGNKITWEIGTLDPGATATLKIKVIVGSTIEAEQIENEAEIVLVGSTTYDPNDSKTPKAKALTDVRTFKVTKEWSGKAGTSATVTLLQNGDEYSTGATVQLDSSNNWTYTWTNLPMYDSSNNLYTYTVEETAIDGYKTEYSYGGESYGNTSAKVTNTRKTYEVIYFTVGAEQPAGVTPPPGETLDWGTAYEAEAPLSADNYVFDGWYTNEECTSAYVDGTIINDNTTTNGKLLLYGKWTRKVEISYEFVGDAPTGAATPTPTHVLPGVKYDAEPTPSEKNYLFEGWYADKACTTPYADGTTINTDTVLYGKWTPYPEVDYKFVGPAPTGATTPAPDFVKPGDAYDAEPTPSAANYVFEGWYADPDCKTPYTDGSVITKNTTLYGKWTPYPEVSYEFVGPTPTGAVTPSPEKVKPGDGYDAQPTPTEKDYTFEGWYADPDCLTPYVDGTKINKDTVLYGKFTPYPEVNYEFVGEYPKGQTTPAPDKVKPGTQYTSEPTPSEKNYIFEGWYADPDCKMPYTDGSVITKTTTLYGKWTPMPEVSYQYVGDVPPDVKVPDGENVDPRVGYDSADKPSKQYYTFDGWFLDPDGTTRYTDGTKITKNTVLYGSWKRNTAPVDPQPGNGPQPDPSDVTYPPKTTTNQGETIPVPPDPTYSGKDYTFDGWYADPDCTIPYEPAVLGPEGLNIYAKWNKNPIVYYSYAGEVPPGAKLPDNELIPYGSKYDSKKPEVPSGYKFSGWYLDPQLTKKYKDGMSITADTYLYGKWDEFDPAVPTGDNFSYKIWGTVLLLSLAGLAIVDYSRRKKEYIESLEGSTED